MGCGGDAPDLVPFLKMAAVRYLGLEGSVRAVSAADDRDGGEPGSRIADLDRPVPDHSTLRGRQKTVTVGLPYRQAGGNLNLLVDNTGVTMAGDGEWQVPKHGPGRRRQWRKVHLAIDAAAWDVRAVEFTSSREGDSPVLPDLLAQVPADQSMGTVTANGAYDTRKCHAAIVDGSAKIIVSIRRTGRAWKEDDPVVRARNETLWVTKRFGWAFWKRWTGDLRPKPGRGEGTGPQSLRRPHGHLREPRRLRARARGLGADGPVRPLPSALAGWGLAVKRIGEPLRPPIAIRRARLAR